MNFTVVWKPPAEEELATLWINAAERLPLTAAADDLDTRLQRYPLGEGESRTGLTRRILFVPPLAVLFDVSELDCLVSVRAVWSPH